MKQKPKIKLNESFSEKKEMTEIKPYELLRMTKEAADCYASEKMMCLRRHRLVVLGTHKSGKTSMVSRLLSKNLNISVATCVSNNILTDITRTIWELDVSADQSVDVSTDQSVDVDVDVLEFNIEYVTNYPVSELFVEDGHTLCVLVVDLSMDKNTISCGISSFAGLFMKRNRKMPPLILVGTHKNSAGTAIDIEKKITEEINIVATTYPDFSVNNRIYVDCYEDGATQSGFLFLRDQIKYELFQHDHIQQGISIPVLWVACQKNVQDYIKSVSQLTKPYQPPKGKKMPTFAIDIKNYRATPIFSCDEFVKKFISPHLTGDDGDRRSQAVLQYLEAGHHIRQAGGNVILNVPWLIREFLWFRYGMCFLKDDDYYKSEDFKSFWYHLDEKIVENTIMPVFFSYGYTPQKKFIF